MEIDYFIIKIFIYIYIYIYIYISIENLKQVSLVINISSI